MNPTKDHKPKQGTQPGTMKTNQTEEPKTEQGKLSGSGIMNWNKELNPENRTQTRTGNSN